MTKSTGKPRLCYVLTSATSAPFLRGQLAWMRDAGFDVTVIASDGPQLRDVCDAEGAASVATPMPREIAPIRDLLALWRLTGLLWRLKPHVVNAGTPKAGLLGMIAAAIVGTPARVYMLRGLRLETTTGFHRRVLWATEWLASALAHSVLCVSESLRVEVKRQRITRSAKTLVVGEGSSNGVECRRFFLAGTDEAIAIRAGTRRELGIAPEAFVYGFVGRLTNDKGAPSLVDAFQSVARDRPHARLLLIGPTDEADAIPASYLRRIDRDPRILMTGAVANTSRLFTAMDVLVHPSLREGLANAPLEAAASGLPVIGRRVTGVVDTIVDGVTGQLVSPSGVVPLASAMSKYCDDPVLATSHGAAARERVEQRFAPERVWRGIQQLYFDLLESSHAPTPQRHERPTQRHAA